MTETQNFPSCRHRVQIPEDKALRARKRQSIAFFTHPDDEVTCYPMCDGPRMYPPVNARAYALQRLHDAVGSRIEQEAFMARDYGGR